MVEFRETQTEIKTVAQIVSKKRVYPFEDASKAEPNVSSKRMKTCNLNPVEDELCQRLAQLNVESAPKTGLLTRLASKMTKAVMAKLTDKNGSLFMALSERLLELNRADVEKVQAQPGRSID